jgi:hypothetical protein
MFPRWSFSVIATILVVSFLSSPALVLAENKNKAATTQKALDATFTAIDIAVEAVIAVMDAKAAKEKAQSKTKAQTAESNSVPTHDSASFTILSGTFDSAKKTAGEVSKEQAQSKKNWAVHLFSVAMQKVAVKLLDKVSEATVNWINKAADGNPQYLENPDQYFKNLGESYLKSVVDTIGYDSDRYPYGRSVARTLILGYLDENKTLEQKLQLTFDETVKADLKKFPNSFNLGGGWNTYEKYYLDSAANNFDAFFTATDYKEKAIKKAQTALQKELDRGRGFMNQKICVAERAGPATPKHFRNNSKPTLMHNSVNVGGTYNDPDYPLYDPDAPTIEYPGTPPGGSTGSGGNGVNNTNQNGTYGTTYTSTGVKPGTGTGECLRYKTLSPGAVVEQQLNRALQSTTFGRTELAAALGNSLSNIVNALSNLLYKQGLKALSSATSGSPVSVNGDTVSWNYDGLTLGGNPNMTTDSSGTDTTNPDNIWDIQDDTFDLYELLVTGPVLATTQVVDANGVISFEPSEFGDTVVETTQKEIALYQEAQTLLVGLPNKMLALDQCLPGPDRNWEARLAARFGEVQTQLSQLLTPAGGPNTYAQRLTTYLNNVKQGIESLITLRTTTYNIPGYASSAGQIYQSGNLDGKSIVYADRIADLTSILSQLQTMADQVAAIGPAEDLTPAEAETLVSIANQYSAIQIDVPSNNTLATAESERNQIKAIADALTKALDTNDPTSCPARKLAAVNQHNFSYVVTPKGARTGTIISGVLSSSQQSSLASGAGIQNLVSGETPQVGQTYDQTTTYHVVRPPSVASVVLINQSQSQMISDLTNNPFNAGSTNLARLNALSQTQLEVVYSAIKGNGAHQYFPNVADSPSLVALALDWFAIEEAATPVTVDETTEQLFYCQSIFDSRDVQNLLKSWNVSISCNDIYQSTLDDYLF